MPAWMPVFDPEANQRLQALFAPVMAAMPELAAAVLEGTAPLIKFQCRKHHPLGTLTLAVDQDGWRMHMPDADMHDVLPASFDGQDRDLVEEHEHGFPVGRGCFDPLRSQLMCRTCEIRQARHAKDGHKDEWHIFTAESMLRGYLWAIKRGRKNLTLTEMQRLAEAKVSIEDLTTGL